MGAEPVNAQSVCSRSGGKSSVRRGCAFLIKFNDTIYIADQDLYEKSTKVEAPVEGAESTYDEWLKLRCANGAVGWILFNEIKDGPDFAAPNLVGYGYASDLQSQSKAPSHE
jgi:hypothetical protein